VPAGSAVRTEPRGYKLPWSEENLARVRGGAARPEGKAADPRPAPERSGADKPTPERAVTDKPASVPPAPPQPSAERLAEVAADRPDFVWPVKGRLIERFEGNSRGIGIAAAEGEPVQAAAAGSVLYAGSGIRGYGQLLIVKHNDSYISVYAHNSRLLVKQGDAVRAGQKIAEVGHTDASRSKLHFEIRRQGTSIDPLSLLPARD
jgi:lipoprotein NlpD